MTDPLALKPATYDFFISHSHLDKAIAAKVCAALEAAGFRCWIAPRNVVPGMPWSAAIVEAIDLSRAMILIFSASANQSEQIQREVDGAVSKHIPVLPMRIEDVPPTGSMEYFLKSVHWLDAFTPPIDGYLLELTDAARTLLSKTAPRSAREGPIAEPPTGVQVDGKPGPQTAPVALATVAATRAARANGNMDTALQVDTKADIEEGKSGGQRKGDSRPAARTRAYLLSLVVLGGLAVGGIVYLSQPVPQPGPQPAPEVQPKAETAKPTDVAIQVPEETVTEWVSLALGTRLFNPSFTESIPTYTDTERSKRSIDIGPRVTIPKFASKQPLARRKVGGEDWIRFPLGDTSGYVPQAQIELVVDPP
jgi:hypothetical protein